MEEIFVDPEKIILRPKNVPTPSQKSLLLSYLSIENKLFIFCISWERQ